MPITDNPYLLFAEVSLELSKGQQQAALQKLEAVASVLDTTYLFNVLYARALIALNKPAQAYQCLRRCCTIAPANQVAWQELATLQAFYDEATLQMPEVPAYDPIADELDQLSAALMNVAPITTSETADPTSIVEQKRPFSDDVAIAVPTESLATLFTVQGAYKKAIKIYSHLIQIKPANAAHYQDAIDDLLEKL